MNSAVPKLDPEATYIGTEKEGNAFLAKMPRATDPNASQDITRQDNRSPKHLTLNSTTQSSTSGDMTFSASLLSRPVVSVPFTPFASPSLFKTPSITLLNLPTASSEI